MKTTVNTKKGKIEYTLYGEGQTLLFIHGGHSNCDETLFHKGFEEYQLLTPSRPGYGNTPLMASNQSPKGTAELIAALLDELDIRSVKVIAISAGGLTGLELAANYPERVTNLVLISALTKKWFTSTDPLYKNGKKIFSPKMEKLSWSIYKFLFRISSSSITKMMFKQISNYRPVYFDKEEEKELMDMTMKMRSYQGFNNDLDQTINQDILQQIKCPTLILHSNYDNSVSLQHAENAKAKIKNSELITFNNRWGHLLWIGQVYKKPLSEILKQWRSI